MIEKIKPVTYHTLPLILLICTLMISTGIYPVFAATGAPAEGEMLKKQFYWQSAAIQFDTLEWPQIVRKWYDKASDLEHSPEASATWLKQSQKTNVYAINKCSAITIALLKDLGYRIVFLTQWNAIPEQKLYVAAAGMDREFKDQRLMTDYLWEELEKVDAVKPTRTVLDFSVKLYCAEGGLSVFSGKSDINQALEQITGTLDGLVLRLSDNSGLDLCVKRRIFRTMLLADESKKLSAIITDLENAMDKINLDFSYTVPTLTLIKPR